MLLRAVTLGDTQAWLDLSHEWDDIVAQLIQDTSVFYEGFDDYMSAKIKQNEAFIAVDRPSGCCLGIVAFSKKNNRISYLGVAKKADFQLVGSKLIEIALNQLDARRETTTTVLKSDLAPVRLERGLYESYGFTECDTVLEAGIPACLMKKSPRFAS
ncbi:MAG TPA: GNAT family N-acetyltransferase [Dehalococcoidales bacterium]|nr:GNAT family N-acetyltransferase [Dehalococcoidales bacterium]